MKRRNSSKGMAVAKVIVLLVLALVLVFLILIMSGRSSEISKQLMSALAGEDKTNNPMCESYRVVTTTQQLKELIVLVATGACGGDTTESAFKFNVTPGPTLTFVTDTPSDDFCGTHRYEIGGLNWTITFGDVEQSDAGCGYNGEPWWEFGIENQQCVSNNNADLIISLAPNGFMGARTTCPGVITAYTIGCAVETGSLMVSHLYGFGLDPVYNPPLWVNPPREGWSWRIKRAGEDVVIC